MSHVRKTHEQCLAETCFFCGKKALNGRQLQEAHVNHIKSSIFATFDQWKYLLPSGMCDACRKGFLKITSPKMNYFALIAEMQKLPKLTRSDGLYCNGPVCELGRSSGKQSKSLTLATKFPPVAVASTSTSNLQNASPDQLMKELPQSTRLRLASATLKEASGGKAGTVSLPTAGRPVNVHLGAIPKQKPPQIPIEAFENLQAEKRLSNNATIAAAAVVRKQMGRKSVAPGLKETLTEKPKKLDAFFSLVEGQYDVPGGGVETREATICTDMPGFLNYTAEERHLEGEFFCRISFDGGGPENSNSLKLILNIVRWVPVSPSSPLSPAHKKTAFDFPPSKSKYKDTGEKAALIIALIPNVSETYRNVKNVFDQIDWEAFGPNFRFALDLKMANIINGQQHHSASFPCNHCTWQYQGFKSIAPAVRKKLKVYPRTIGSQKLLADQFSSATGAMKNPINFYSTPFKPLIPGPNSQRITYKNPPPELHILEGIGNNLLCKCNKDLGGDGKQYNPLFDWLNGQGIYRRNFTYQGNSIRDVLDFHLDSLRDWLPAKLHKYVDVFEQLKLIKDSCFGFILAPDYKVHIAEFKKVFLEAGFDEFPKVHILWTHVPEFCDMERRGLGIFSEQTGEAVHEGFAGVLKNYNPNHQQNQRLFGKTFFEAVKKYNSMNI